MKVTCKRLLALGGFLGGIGLANSSCRKKLLKAIDQMPAFKSRYQPYQAPISQVTTFDMEEDFRVLQLTDLHIGGGFLSYKKDLKALEAVYESVKKTQPDLILLTGDLTYSVPFQTGSIANHEAGYLIARLMEQMSLPWTMVFGNHDYEVFSLKGQKFMSHFYGSKALGHCLYEEGPKDIKGYGNSYIELQHKGQLIRRLYLMDSGSYCHPWRLGLDYLYDCIDQTQVIWYLKTLQNYKEGDLASSLFIHMPLRSYKAAYREVLSGKKTFEFGKVGEGSPYISCSKKEDLMTEAILKGGSTDSVFVGHDHLNTFSVIYKGVLLTYGMSIDYLLTYGMSIDYLAYKGIDYKHDQRGGLLITYMDRGRMKVQQVPLKGKGGYYEKKNEKIGDKNAL